MECDWNMLEFKYLGCVLDKSGIYEPECCRKLVSGRRFADAIRSLVDVMGLPVTMHGSETMIWKEEERSRIRADRWTTSEICWVSGEWIKSQMHR